MLGKNFPKAPAKRSDFRGLLQNCVTLAPSGGDLANIWLIMRHLVAVLRSLGVKNFDRGRISGLFQQSGQAGQMDQRQRSKNGLGEVSPGGSEIILFGRRLLLPLAVLLAGCCSVKEGYSCFCNILVAR